MRNYNFDEGLDRRNTACGKWDGAKVAGYPEDILSMWVADMEFPVLPQIEEALERRVVDHPIYGYSTVVPGQNEAACAWMKRRHGWDAKPEWIVATPGIVCALKMAVQCFTEPGEAVLICNPVYYPFTKAVVDNNRKLVNSPLQLREGRYEMDFEDLEAKIVDNDVKMFILCSPHNPVGRVWTREELKRAGDICRKHNVLVIADEIHEDFIFKPHRFVPFLTVDAGYEQNTIVCTAPSKTFNVAGLKFSNIFIPNEELRGIFKAHLDRCGIGLPNTFGSIASKAAYEFGDEYADELAEAIQENVRYFKEYLGEKLPMLKVVDQEGLYLTWVDVSALGLEGEALTKFMIWEAKVWLDEGYIFGEEGNCYERFNLACPKRHIKEAVDRIYEAALRKNLI